MEDIENEIQKIDEELKLLNKKKFIPAMKINPS